MSKKFKIETNQPITVETLVEKIRHGEQLKQLMDIFIPLALQLPQLRDDPKMMEEVVKATGKEGITDVATSADLFMQNALKKKVVETHPDWQFWGEEDKENITAYDETKNFLFITDPIEGTNNFKAGNDDLWGSVSALVDIKTKKPIIGIIAHPSKRKFYCGIDGGGAYVIDCDEKGNIIRISSMSSKSEFPEFTYNNSPHFEKQLAEQVDRFFLLGEVASDASGDKLAQSRKKVKVQGDTFLDPESGALEAVRNRGTIYFKTSAEMAAVFVIIQELGGKVTDGEGKPWTLGINSLIAARNEEDYKKLKTLYEKARGA